MQIFFILFVPVFIAGLPLFIKKYGFLGRLNASGHFLIALAAMWLASDIIAGRTSISFLNLFYVDALSAFFILVVSIVNFASALYSIRYIGEDIEEGILSENKARVYYALFNIFCFSMFFVTVVNNLGMLWAAIEMTTLASAFLVGFHNDKASIEAAWKYVIICSVGITLALLGTILFYYTVSMNGGLKTLNWTDMVSVASRLDPNIVKVAFLFVLVGYGTKAGLVPMHTWLPDAHSQAPAPISALLSGVLLKTAIYAILRFTVIINKCIGSQYSGNLLVFFGLLSLGVSAGFILVQKDIKRLLAYHSVEHIGIIAVGLGLGGPLGLYGALLHVLNHAVTKSLMFFGAGNAAKKYGTVNMHLMKGVINAMPFTGIMLLLGAFALAGSPPFSIFISEIMILISGFAKGSYLVSIVFLSFIVIIFGAIINHFGRVIFGKRPENMPVLAEPLSGKMAFVFLLMFICVIGFNIPTFLNRLILSGIDVLKGA